MSRWWRQVTKGLTGDLTSEDEEEARALNSEAETPNWSGPCCQQDGKCRGSVVGMRLDFAPQSLGYTG